MRMQGHLLDVPSTMKHQIWAERLAGAFGAGVLVLDEKDRIAFVNERANRLLGTTSASDLEQLWPRLQQRLPRLPAPISASQPADAGIVLGLADGIDGADVRVRTLDLDGDESGGRLLIIEPADRAAALEATFRHATRDRGLASLFRHLSHDVKGLLNVLSMNLEILTHV